MNIDSLIYDIAAGAVARYDLAVDEREEIETQLYEIENEMDEL